MKHFNPQSALLLLAAFVVINLASCSKEQLMPAAADPSKEISAHNAALTPASDALDSLTVSTFYKGFGDGNATPIRICTAPNQSLYVSTFNSVRKITPQGVASTLFTFDQYVYLVGIKAAPNGDVYVANFGADFGQGIDRSFIIKLDPSGNASAARMPDSKNPLYAVRDLAIADDNTLYIANTGGFNIVRVNAEKTFKFVGNVSQNPGYMDGIGTNTSFVYPSNLKLSKDNNLYVVDDSLGFQDTYINKVVAGVTYHGYGGRSIRKITMDRKVTTIYRATGGRRIVDFAIAKRDQNFKLTSTEAIFAIFDDNSISYISTTGVEIPLTTNTAVGFTNGKLRNATFGLLTGITIHENFMDVIDQANHAIRRIMRK